MAQIARKCCDGVVTELLRRSNACGRRNTGCLTRRLHSETSSTRRPEATAFGQQDPQKEKCNALKMTAWQIHDYGDLQELQYSDNVKMPKIQQANECLIKVLATSVNPIDVAMLSELPVASSLYSIGWT